MKSWAHTFFFVSLINIDGTLISRWCSSTNSIKARTYASRYPASQLPDARHFIYIHGYSVKSVLLSQWILIWFYRRRKKKYGKRSDRFELIISWNSLFLASLHFVGYDKIQLFYIYSSTSNSKWPPGDQLLTSHIHTHSHGRWTTKLFVIKRQNGHRFR